MFVVYFHSDFNRNGVHAHLYLVCVIYYAVLIYKYHVSKNDFVFFPMNYILRLYCTH